VPNSDGAVYTGPEWNSNAVAVDDLDGDGHDDIYLGDYFPDSPVLDATKNGGVSMNESLSNATNGGPDHVFRWTSATKGPKSTVTFAEAAGAIPAKVSKGWVLGVGANDLDGDQLPELYVAQDHGADALLYNRSTPGHIAFAEVYGVRTPMLPKSKRIGADSFKGMGVDFGDLNGDGLYDMFVSNITTTFGIEESNLQFQATAKDQAGIRSAFQHGKAPYQDVSTRSGTAWGGWCWDVKLADFNNSGELAIAQTNGFVKGDVNRWAQLQELATSNDLVTEHPEWWPHVEAGDDIAGSQRLNFFARSSGGKYVNISNDLGLDVPVPTRGIAIGDTDGDGRLDLAVARQWDQPAYYHNDSPTNGAYLDLQLTDQQPATPGALPAPGSPAVGAQVRVTTPDGRVRLGRVDGGSGHSGKRSSEVHIGLGAVSGPVPVHLTWRDRSGTVHQQDLTLSPGRHALSLGTTATER
jgi:hypothetical protein